MVDYQTKAPGVYVEEVPVTGPIVGAGTSTAALIGAVKSTVAPAALGVPVAITNWTEFVTAFGDYKVGLNLPYAVWGFFQNGGTVAYVVPIKDASGMATALDGLSRRPEVGLVCAPGVTDATAQALILKHCDDMRDRFAVLDGVQDPNPLDAAGALQTQRAALKTPSAAYGALYWPWIRVADPLAPPDKPGSLVEVPPSGHVAGIMARSDNKVGVHKAPANESVVGAVDLGRALNDTEQGQLNHNHINAIRRFPGGPPVVWGARTLSEDTAWRFVNVRRLLCYLEDSITQGVRWAVFAPNNTTLWKGLERTISEFLTRVWEAGGLFGRTAKEAFYVKIDEELNPPAVRQAGQVFVEIGVQPTGPAEFIVLQFGLWAGGARITEG